MKKISITFLLSVLSCFALFGQNVNEFEFTINGSGNARTVTITGYTGTERNIRIPERINGVPVTVIGKWAFYQKSGKDHPRPFAASAPAWTRGGLHTPNAWSEAQRLELGLLSVVIPNTVKTIEEDAFAINALTSVTIPNSVTEIGRGAFRLNLLTSVTILNAVTKIEEGAFRGNPMEEQKEIGDYSVLISRINRNGNNGTIKILKYKGSSKNIQIPLRLENIAVSEIGDRAFENMELINITIHDGITTIGYRAFAQNKLTSVILPDSVSEIGTYAFDTNSITHFVLSRKMTHIPEGLFIDNNLTNINIPNTITWIGGYAFANNKIETVTIPNGVTLLSQYSFYNNNINRINIPVSLKTFEAGVFSENPINAIIIGSNVDFYFQEDASRSADDYYYHFRMYYNNSGKKAGRYVFNNGRWNYSAS